MPKQNERKLPYIEPTIRTIIGVYVTACGILFYLHPDQRWIWIFLLAFAGVNLLISAATGFCIIEKSLKLLRFRSELDEITELNKARAAAEARADYLNTLSLFDEVVIELSLRGCIVQVSDCWGKLLGGSAGLITGQPDTCLADYLERDDRPLLEEGLAKLRGGEQDTVSVRFRLQRQDGGESWVEGRFTLHRQEGRIQGIRGVLRDITESYLQEKRITQMALHDALTGLPNRILLEDRMDRAICQARRMSQRVALMFVDLDNFKQVNDVYGHKAGDQLLLAVTKCLQESLRESDTLARWGGDEFVILVPEADSLDSIRALGERLLESVHKKLFLEDVDAYISLSIGAAMFPDDAESCEALLIQADKALFHAKSQGRNNIQLFSTLQSQGLVDKEFDLGSRLRAAVRQGQIQVHYQPLVDARSGCIQGLEALARWHDEKHGWVGPGTFVHMAECLGLIHALGQQVIEQALAQLRRWQEQGLSLRLSVNISKRQLFSPDFVHMLLRLTEQHAIQPRQLTLEVTESLAMQDAGQAAACLAELSKAGFVISLDDFGTGYSALSHLHEMPVNELKIDLSFVRRIKTAGGRSMVQSIADMGHALGLCLVAEGVEDGESAQILREIGVEVLQGYYFGRPMPAAACHDWILQRNCVRRESTEPLGGQPTSASNNLRSAMG